MSCVTIVSGIWDIKRNELTEGWRRDFSHYLNHFENLLKIENNMIIFIEEKYRSFVEERRSYDNTLIISRELDWFKSNGEFFNKIQKIRQDPNWYGQSGWLVDSTQAKLEMYNPLVMSKMFLLNDANILDPFDSSHLIWIDGAITNTVNNGYFSHDKVLNKAEQFFDKFTFVCFPYDGKVEIHGFEYQKMCEYSGCEVNMVARGGIFGGAKESIAKMNQIYYGLVSDTLNNGLMGTEESIFTIMAYKYPDLIDHYMIEPNGLLYSFFEKLKNTEVVIKPKNYDLNNTALYVITYNSPSQFEKLCISFNEYDKNFLKKPKKFLLNNSLDHNTDNEYKKLCKKYGFTEIKKDNLGICGGRQFIAEHADENNFDYYFFFEDDMFFYLGEDKTCRNGFVRKVNNLYDNSLKIISTNDFDFLKLNFTEFYGDNSLQWSWHNVPADVRAKLFPDKPQKVDNDVNAAPNLSFKSIKSYNGIPYATGEIYYCNWPQIVSKSGNKKMFIKTKFAHPFEQTWMSFIYQETVKNRINPAILLATPTEHDRFDFYPSEERKEN